MGAYKHVGLHRACSAVQHYTQVGQVTSSSKNSTVQQVQGIVQANRG